MNLVKLFVKSSNQISSLIAIKGYTQKALASDIELTAPYLSSIINGNKSIGKSSAKRLAKKLDVNMDDIFFASAVDKSFTSDVTNGTHSKEAAE